MSDTLTLDPLLYVQEAVRDHLIKDPKFQELQDSIILADRGTVLDGLDQLVAKLGVAIIIEPTEADIQYSGNNIILNFDESSPISITVWESVTTNRSPAGTRRRASELAIQIAKQFRPGQTPAAPVTIRKARLASDSNNRCIYTLVAVGRFTIAS